MRVMSCLWGMLWSSTACAGILQGTIDPEGYTAPVRTSAEDHSFWRLGIPRSVPERIFPAMVVLEGATVPTEPNRNNTSVIRIEDYEFRPSVSVVPLRGSLELKNMGNQAFSCDSQKEGKVSFGDMAPGVSVTQKLNSEGKLTLLCHRYPFMQAVIWVKPQVLTTTTDPSGAFSFSDLAPGEYQLTALVGPHFLGTTRATVTATGTTPVIMRLQSKTEAQSLEPKSLLPITAAKTAPTKEKPKPENTAAKPAPAATPEKEKTQPKEGKPGKGKAAPVYHDAEPEIEIEE